MKKRTVETLDEIQDGTISVHLKGALLVGTSQKGDAAEELSHVIVQAGGTDVSLNWSKSDAILDELFWWRFPHAGDLRNAQAEVTGQMKFIPVKDLGRGFFPEGTAADTIVPVVVDESLTVQLAGPDGRRRGPQQDKKRVTSADRSTQGTTSGPKK